MLQIDHVYNFLYQELFKDFDLWHLRNGVIKLDNINIHDLCIFTPSLYTTKKIFFYDQEPLIDFLSSPYMKIFTWSDNYSDQELVYKNTTNSLPYGIHPITNVEIQSLLTGAVECIHKQGIIATSEKSQQVHDYLYQYNLKSLYYFFHGFAALDWYRGFYALNYNKNSIKNYTYNYCTFNRLISNDRSYRCYFVSQLIEYNLLDQGQVSFGLTNEQGTWQDAVIDQDSKLSANAVSHINQYLPKITTPLIIDSEHILGSASADIPLCINDSLWHIVTETVFYYNKLHLTEKIFKPIVSKQPFMLLAAPGNLAYLRSYGFKTFDGIIDESYDLIQDPDARTQAVVAQLQWYCNLSAQEKNSVIERLAPIVEHNFHHFYGEFRHVITRELLANTKAVFKEIGYDDQAIAYDDVYRVLTT